MKIFNSFFLWALVEGNESVGPDTGSSDPVPAPQPAPTGNSEIVEKVTAGCRKPDDAMLTSAANTLVDACNSSGNFSPLQDLASRIESKIPMSGGSLHCMETDKSNGDAADIMVGRSSDICIRSFMGAARSGKFICVISADIRSREPTQYIETPQYQAPKPAPAQPEPEPQYKPAPPAPEPRQSYPETPTPPPSGGDYGGFDEKCFQLTNSFRGGKGLPALRHSSLADGICYTQSKCMDAKNVMDHNACGSFKSRLQQGGANNMVAAENIAGGVTGPDEVVNRWIESPGHNKNMSKGDINTMSCCQVGGFGTQIFLGESGY